MPAMLYKKFSRIKLCLLLTWLLSYSTIGAQVITTIAGTGANAETGNGGLATAAGTPAPYGICVNANGDVFFGGTNTVRKIDKTTGLVTLFAGTGIAGYSGDGGPATAAAMRFPDGLCADINDNIYIAEYGGHRVRKVNAATHIISTVAGNGTEGFGGDGGPAASASLAQPHGICTDYSGNLYICDYKNSRIRKVDAVTHIITTIAGTGSILHSGDNGLATLAGIPYPVSVCADVFDNLYFVEVYSSSTCRIRRIDKATGIVATVAGYNSYGYSGDGGPAINASLFDPTGLSIDRDGNIYVAEYDDSRIRKIDAATGIINTLAGTGENGYNGDCMAAAGALLNNPVSLCTDGFENIYIADNANNRIRKIIQSAGTGAPAIAIAASSTDACRNGSITFTATISNAGVSSVLQWKKNNQLAGVSSPTYTAGFYPGDIVTCALVPDNPCINDTVYSNSITLTGVNNGQPAVTIAANKTTVCIGTAVTVVATNANNSVEAGYHWLVNDKEVNALKDTFVFTAPAGGSKINCIITAHTCGGNWASISNEIQIVAYPSQTPSVNISIPDSSLCGESEATFTAAVKDAGANPSYQWKINGNIAGINSAQFTTGNLSNDDAVSCVLTADASEHCYTPTTVSSNVIKVTIAPKLDNAHFNISSSATNTCAGENVSFTADYVLPENGSFTWQINDTDVRTFSMYQPFTTTALKDGDNVRCIYKSDDACRPQWISDSIRIAVKPSPVITILPADTAVVSGSKVQLRTVLQGEVSGYAWMPAEKLVSSQSLAPFTTPIIAAVTYTLRAMGTNGCEATGVSKIKVIYILHMPSGFTPNGDGINDVFRIPPPASLTLENFSVYNRWGGIVFSTKDLAKGWDGKLNNLYQATGTYLYIIKARNELGEIFQRGTVLLLR